MTVLSRTLLAELRAYGCTVRPDGEQIRIRGPVKCLPPELLERVRASKLELLRLLTARPAPLSAPSSAAIWARYFARFPEELARLAAAAEQAGLSGTTRPDGVNTTAYHWACWFAAHPREIDQASGAITKPDDVERP